MFNASDVDDLSQVFVCQREKMQMVKGVVKFDVASCNKVFYCEDVPLCMNVLCPISLCIQQFVSVCTPCFSLILCTIKAIPQMRDTFTILDLSIEYLTKY